MSSRDGWLRADPRPDGGPARGPPSSFVHLGTFIPQNPPMHWSVPQQGSAGVHLLPSAVQVGAGGTPHLPIVHEPPQQSTPLSHAVPSPVHGERTENARMLPLVSSCPGNMNGG